MSTTTVQNAARTLGMTPGAVRGLLATGYLKGKKVGRVWEISLESVQVLQALLRVPLRLAPPCPSIQEQSAFAGDLCPVCAGQTWGPARQGSQWSHEFLECSDCAFSLHSSFLDQSAHETIRQRVQDHLETLVSIVRNGEAARMCLQRRAEFIHKQQG